MEQITDKLYNWASVLDPLTRAQACETVRMPFIQPHLALMPDAHLGLGATVGSVIPTVGAIMPAAVGVDIGCGMNAVRTQFTLPDVQGTGRDPRGLHAAIAAAIPLSAGNQNRSVLVSARDRVTRLEAMAGIEQADEVAPRWRLQLGSLGSGNHFIEVSLDEADRVWLFLHSGSRGVGNKLAQRHIRVAQQVCQGAAAAEPGSRVPDGGHRRVRSVHPSAALGADVRPAEPRGDDGPGDRLHLGVHGSPGAADGVGRLPPQLHRAGGPFRSARVWLSRKGAINAEAGRPGLVPGSMGDRSYVVVGKGDERALRSAPHGAGREHSRRKAKQLFTRADLNARMAGVAWGESDSFLDEHPLAYKRIDQVMADAADLVTVTHELRQIVNVKGD